jgi:4-diphosphocytidyl-2-C-methyl-D-erythritol kinase
MICFPNAKVNMGLSVLDKRPDGFHNLSTCIIPIPIYDILEVTLSETFRFVNYGLKVPGINIINKTWKYLTGVFDKIAPVSICLYKNIPMGAGLGGGSSDATFFLKMINDICKLSLSHIELMEIANLIGSDCPFFIENTPSIVTGKGDKLLKVANPFAGKYITLIYPQININTRNAFSFVKDNFSATDYSNILANELLWKNHISNDFEEFVFCEHPHLLDLKNKLYQNNALYASLTGSGSSLYAISEKEIDISWINKAYFVQQRYMG